MKSAEPRKNTAQVAAVWLATVMEDLRLINMKTETNVEIIYQLQSILDLSRNRFKSVSYLDDPQ